MTGENGKDLVHPDGKLEGSILATERGHARVISVVLLLSILVVIVLVPGLLSENGDISQVATISEDTATVIPPVTPEQTRELSPRALEDLRTSPIENLTINPEPLLLELLPEGSEETAIDNEPAVADNTPQVQEEPAPIAPEEPFSVGEALARYLLAIREQLNSEYVANCIRHRNRNGAGADCPTDPAFATTSSYQQEQELVDDLFAIITRREDYARISSRLERENETLASILGNPDNPTAALQASTKLALNNAYLDYLNGNPNPAVVRFNTMNNFINDYNRTIRAGPLQFRCQNGPCVYEYTGPGAQ